MEKPRCYRVEPRTVIPGIKIEVGKTVGGQPAFEERNTLFVVIEGKTDKTLSKHGTVFRSSTEMRPSEFFESKVTAEGFACQMHQRIGCTDPRCGWNQVSEEVQKGMEQYGV